MARARRPATWIAAGLFWATAALAPAQAAEPLPGPAKYEVPFSAPQNFIDHAQYFAEETEVIRIGPSKVWNFNTPNRGFGNVAGVEGEKELLVIDTTRSDELPTPIISLRREG